MDMTRALFLLPLLVLLPGQEPATRPAPRPAPPPGAFPGLPPREAREPLTPAAGLLGAWEIRRLVAPSAPPGVKIRGYILFSRTHASFHALLQESQAEPLFQSTFWRYSVTGARLRFQALLGLRSDPQGRIRTGKTGATEERTFEFVGGMLRLHRGGGSYMELVRLE